jgi:hypothetical protein
MAGIFENVRYREVSANLEILKLVVSIEIQLAVQQMILSFVIDRWFSASAVESEGAVGLTATGC